MTGYSLASALLAERSAPRGVANDRASRIWGQETSIFPPWAFNCGGMVEVVDQASQKEGHHPHMGDRNTYLFVPSSGIR